MTQTLAARAQIKALNQDRRSISYRPDYAVLTGSPTAAILLQQILFRWETAGWQPFYKFKVPCKHTKYRDGDSWCEELFWSRAEFDTAIKKIGTKIVKGVSKNDAIEYKWPEFPDDPKSKEYRATWEDAISHIVVYWTDKNRVTWYLVNELVLYKATISLYIGKAPKSLYISKAAISLFTSISETTADKDDDEEGATRHIEAEGVEAKAKALAAIRTDENESPSPVVLKQAHDPQKLITVVAAYEQNIGAITPMIRDELVDALDEYPAEWIVDAIRETVTHNARNWRYALAVLENWKKHGRNSQKPTGKTAAKAAAERRIKAKTHYPAPVPGCPTCGGTGAILDAKGTMQPCPDCLAAEEAADERVA